VRILQVPWKAENVPISEIVGGLTNKHCQWVLQMTRQNASPDLTLAIMQIETQRVTSFMIVDRRHVVIEINGLDSEGNTYAAGFLFVEDRGGKFVQHFLRYFGDLERRASASRRK
jgi:hypothetical protein